MGASVVLVLYWCALVATVAAAAALSVVAWRSASRAVLYSAAGALALGLLLAAVPLPDPGFALGSLVTVLVIVAAVAGGGPAAAHVLSLTSRGTVRDGTHGGIILRHDGRDAEVLRGGTTIGLLERLAVAGTLLAGFPEGLAVVVAIKGVGRFSELDSSETRERFIIGSLVSVIWAACAAGIALLARS
ncbi:hypothetical protein ACFSBZ_01105 [Amnibacterium flavum]|uniref:Uncharacterized protein n=1 Tax=Amnibacterium flavum TaxID=2173173 RepID=A0A2V1HM59_9MICO|nr:hypothetical protein [Amnibacterium flavum]PVZ93491.1 hypothetical protein DDQ50_14290 [Amnibacterium flavum]